MMFVNILIFLLMVACPACAKDPFVCITPEKTGTHLLLKALRLLTGMEDEHDWHRDIHEHLYHQHLWECEKHGTFSHMHINADEKYRRALRVRKYKVIFLMRDPRDQLVSMYYYIRDRGWIYNMLSMQTRFAGMSFDDQIDEMITGKRFGTSVPNVVVGWKMPWMFVTDPEVYTARYENLVGPKGGGSREAQIAELTGIVKFLNLKVNDKRIAAIADVLYGKPGEATFNTGQIGTWKSTFNELHKEHFKKVFGDKLILLGYESDYDW